MDSHPTRTNGFLTGCLLNILKDYTATPLIEEIPKYDTTYQSPVQGEILGKCSPVGRLISFKQILKITEIEKKLGYFFPRKNVRIGYDKQRFGLHFVQFFHKLIWSPWSSVTMRLVKEAPDCQQKSPFEKGRYVFVEVQYVECQSVEF
jgi:hypothetical protein